MEYLKLKIEKEISDLENELNSLPKKIRVKAYNAFGKDYGSEYLNNNKAGIDNFINELIAKEINKELFFITECSRKSPYFLYKKIFMKV